MGSVSRTNSSSRSCASDRAHFRQKTCVRVSGGRPGAFREITARPCPDRRSSTAAGTNVLPPSVSPQMVHREPRDCSGETAGHRLGLLAGLGSKVDVKFLVLPGGQTPRASSEVCRAWLPHENAALAPRGWPLSIARSTARYPSASFYFGCGFRALPLMLCCPSSRSSGDSLLRNVFSLSGGAEG